MSKPEATLDCEVYKNYFLAKIKRIDTGAVRVFEQYDGLRLDTAGLRATLDRVTSITFNGKKYDQPIVSLALTGASCQMIKRCSDFIIQGKMQPWEAESQFNFRIVTFDMIDLIEVVPGMVSLKLYMGRLHCPKLQDLPIEHDASILPEQRPIIVDYNDNDLFGTAALKKKFEKQIDLRRQMSREYGIDLRSKSDAQIAEAVIKAKLTDQGVDVRKPEIKGRSFKFRFPMFLKHGGPVIQDLIAQVREADFIVDSDGYVKMPEQLAKVKIKIGDGVYRMGIGGLHSSEQSVAHLADEDTLIIDRDVASYYPAVIINTGLYPRHLGKAFLDVYRGIRDQRLIAKKAGDKSKADTFKIVLNGSFGKFGNPWSILYSPDLLIQTTVTGQLALLMLIDLIEAYSPARVVSANTDGIVIKCPRSGQDALNAVIKKWEEVTGFETEETRYKAIYSRDVNSYLALKHKFDSEHKVWLNETDGFKLKGAYAEPEPVASSWPSPHCQICVKAVCDFLEHGVPIDMTIDLADDVRDFVAVRNVTGGATWRGEYLGRAVRWYYSTDGEPIFYKKQNKKGNHNKVADTDDCRPLMFMNGSMPPDIDRQWYVDKAQSILNDIGFVRMANATSYRHS